MSHLFIDTAIDQGDRVEQQDAIAVLPLHDGAVAAAVCDGLGAHSGSEYCAAAAAWAWVTTAAQLAGAWRGAARLSHLRRMAAAADDAARLGNPYEAQGRECPRTAIGAVLVVPPTDDAWSRSRNPPWPVWAWALGDVLVVVVDAEGKPRVVSRPHRAGRHVLSRCLPKKATDYTTTGPSDLAEPVQIASLAEGEMLIIATDGAWEVEPSERHAGFDEADGAEFLARAAGIAFERARPRPADEIIAASKARWKGGCKDVGSRDNAAVVVIARPPITTGGPS